MSTAPAPGWWQHAQQHRSFMVGAVLTLLLLLAAMVVVVNFVVDMLYAVFDPRIQASDI